MNKTKPMLWQTLTRSFSPTVTESGDLARLMIASGKGKVKSYIISGTNQTDLARSFKRFRTKRERLVPFSLLLFCVLVLWKSARGPEKKLYGCFLILFELRNTIEVISFLLQLFRMMIFTIISLIRSVRYVTNMRIVIASLWQTSPNDVKSESAFENIQIRLRPSNILNFID